MAARSTAIKIIVGIAALGVVGVLFVRSARSTRAEPYEIRADRFRGWQLEIDATPTKSGALLSLRSTEEVARELFNQVFQRSGESMSGPNPAAVPLVLANELGATPAITPDALLDMARTAGLEPPMFGTVCMAYRRESAPGSTRQVYFLRFQWGAFDAFRQQLAQRLRATGGAGSFDPAGLSPVLIVAASDIGFARWLPLQKGTTDDCIAPLQLRQSPG